MKKLICAVIVLAVSWSPVAAGQLGRIVYMGLDPASDSHHPAFPETTLLAQNAVTWVGKSADPVLGYAAGEDPGEVLILLTAAGFTNLTELTARGLAVADLSVFDVLYIGVVIDGFNYAAAAANVQTFVDNGGGLVAGTGSRDRRHPRHPDERMTRSIK